MKNTERLYAATGACIGGIALLLQLVLILANVDINAGASYFQEALRFISYMMILSNLLVTIFFISKAFNTRFLWGLKGSSVEAALFIYMAVVFTVYHAVLARLWNPAGWQWLADFLLHTLMPLTYFVYWFAFSEKNKIAYSQIVYWLSFPLLYLIYALIRGYLTNLYPYPFLDLNELPVNAVIINCLIITTGYFILSVLIIFINNRVASAQTLRRTRNS